MIPLRAEHKVASVPLVTGALLAAIAAVFLWQVSLEPSGFDRAIFSFGVIPAVLFGHLRMPPEFAVVPPVVTILTSMFLHGGWLHLAGNMLYLWVFGPSIEDRLGRARFLGFYLVCGVVAALAQALPAPETMAPMIGASGAISGAPRRLRRGTGGRPIVYGTETLNLNEWLTLMIDEIRRKQDEEAQAELERERRVAAEPSPADHPPGIDRNDSPGHG